MGNTPSAVLMHALPCALRQTETIPERTRGDKLRKKPQKNHAGTAKSSHL